MDRGLEQHLRDLVRDSRLWCALGIVTAIDEHDAWGYRLTVTLQPLALEVHARPGQAGCGSDGRGVWVPFEVDAEVFLHFPGGDVNRAVAYHGPTSTPALPPTGWANDHVEIVHDGGLEVRNTQGAPIQKVVTEDLLADLAAYVAEVATAITGVGGTAPPSSVDFASSLGTAYRSAALETE